MQTFRTRHEPNMQLHGITFYEAANRKAGQYMSITPSPLIYEIKINYLVLSQEPGINPTLPLQN